MIVNTTTAKSGNFEANGVTKAGNGKYLLKLKVVFVEPSHLTVVPFQHLSVSSIFK